MSTLYMEVVNSSQSVGFTKCRIIPSIYWMTHVYHILCARYASKIWAFSNLADIVIFLSSGVARQHRKARDDLIALLPYGFSNLRYYKHNISDVLVYKR